MVAARIVSRQSRKPAPQSVPAAISTASPSQNAAIKTAKYPYCGNSRANRLSPVRPNTAGTNSCMLIRVPMNIQTMARFTHNAQDPIDIRRTQAGVHRQLQRVFRRLCARTLGAELLKELQFRTNVNMRRFDIDTAPDRPLTQLRRIGGVHAVLIKDVLDILRHPRSLNVPTIN